MANTKASAESAAAALDGTEIVRIVQSGSSVRTTVGGMSRVAQVVNTQTGAVATGTTTVPLDDTIPQNTEGTEFMTLAITPTSATSTLLITAELYLTCASADKHMIAALFQDTTAGALAAAVHYNATAGGGSRVIFSHKMTSGTTSATTFKVRAGPNAAATITFNGAAGGRIFGGVAASSITITEMRPF